MTICHYYSMEILLWKYGKYLLENWVKKFFRIRRKFFFRILNESSDEKVSARNKKNRTLNESSLLLMRMSVLGMRRIERGQGMKWRLIWIRRSGSGSKEERKFLLVSVSISQTIVWIVMESKEKWPTEREEEEEFEERGKTEVSKEGERKEKHTRKWERRKRDHSRLKRPKIGLAHETLLSLSLSLSHSLLLIRSPPRLILIGENGFSFSCNKVHPSGFLWHNFRSFFVSNHHSFRIKTNLVMPLIHNAGQ